MYQHIFAVKNQIIMEVRNANCRPNKRWYTNNQSFNLSSKNVRDRCCRYKELVNTLKILFFFVNVNDPRIPFPILVTDVIAKMNGSAKKTD